MFCGWTFYKDVAPLALEGSAGFSQASARFNARWTMTFRFLAMPRIRGR